MKPSALIWRNHISNVIGNELGFKYSLSHPYIWMKTGITSSVPKYYAYILVYADDILIIDKDPFKHMDTLRENYTIKISSIRETKLYLGADVNKVFYPAATQHQFIGISRNKIRLRHPHMPLN